MLKIKKIIDETQMAEHGAIDSFDVVPLEAL